MTDSEALAKLTDVVRLRHFSHATEKAYGLNRRKKEGVDSRISLLAGAVSVGRSRIHGLQSAR
jgi:hypothetical protein